LGLSGSAARKLSDDLLQGALLDFEVTLRGDFLGRCEVVSRLRSCVSVIVAVPTSKLRFAWASCSEIATFAPG